MKNVFILTLLCCILSQYACTDTIDHICDREDYLGMWMAESDCNDQVVESIEIRKGDDVSDIIWTHHGRDMILTVVDCEARYEYEVFGIKRTAILRVDGDMMWGQYDLSTTSNPEHCTFEFRR